MILEFWHLLVIVFLPFGLMVFEFYWFKTEIDFTKENFDKKFIEQKKEIELLRFNIEQLQSSKKKKEID